MSALSYPIHLNLVGRPVLVAGAGRVATRKIERLVEAQAALTVVSLHASSIVQRLADTRQLALALRGAREEDTQGKLLVLCATDDAALNAALARAGRAAGALVSRVDAPEDSDFTVPAVARGTCVEATVSTAGAAPSASRRLARELRAWVGCGPDRFASEVARARIALRGQPDATERLRKLSNGPLFEACARGDESGIHQLMAAVMRAEASS